MNKESINEFLQEVIPYLKKIKKGLESIEENYKQDTESVETYNDLFVLWHTIKGSCGMFGLDDLQQVCTRLEEYFNLLRQKKIIITDDDIVLINEVFICISKSLAVEYNENFGNIKKLSQYICQFNEICSQDNQTDDYENKKLLAGLKNGQDLICTVTEYEESRIIDNLKNNNGIYFIKTILSLNSFDQDLKNIKDAIEKIGEQIAIIPEGQLSDDNNFCFNILFASADPTNQIKDCLSSEYGLEVIKEPEDPDVFMDDDIAGGFDDFDF